MAMGTNLYFASTNTLPVASAPNNSMTSQEQRLEVLEAAMRANQINNEIVNQRINELSVENVQLKQELEVAKHKIEENDYERANMKRKNDQLTQELTETKHELAETNRKVTAEAKGKYSDATYISLGHDEAINLSKEEITLDQQANEEYQMNLGVAGYDLRANTLLARREISLKLYADSEMGLSDSDKTFLKDYDERKAKFSNW